MHVMLCVVKNFINAYLKDVYPSSKITGQAVFFDNRGCLEAVTHMLLHSIIACHHVSKTQATLDQCVCIICSYHGNIVLFDTIIPTCWPIQCREKRTTSKYWTRVHAPTFPLFGGSTVYSYSLTSF